MNALHGMDRYRKEVTQVRTLMNDIKVQYGGLKMLDLRSPNAYLKF